MGGSRIPWRRDPAILARLVEVERRYLAGETKAAIAAALGVDEGTVRHDVKRLEGLWLERTASQVVQRRARRLRELELLRQAALAAAAWDEACERAVLFGVSVEIGGELRQVLRDDRGMAQFRGNKAAALSVARQAIMDAAKLEGLVVDKVAPTDEDGRTLDLATLLALARQSGDGHG